LVSFSLAGAKEAQLVHRPRRAASTKSSAALADSVHILNAGELRVDKDCLAAKVLEFEKLVEHEALDPIRAEVSGRDDPLVKDITEKAHIELSFKGRVFMMPLEALHPRVIAISKVNNRESFAAFGIQPQYGFSFISCVAKK